MFGEPVASAVVIIVTVVMLVPVMSIAVALGQHGVARKRQKSESNDGKPFCSFQEFPPMWRGLDF